MREGFKHLDAKIENVRQEINTRLDKIEKRLDEHDTIFARNNLK